jgi:anti-anti-sigma factor
MVSFHGQPAPHRCPACGGPVLITPVERVGDSPCPHCRCLLWFVTQSVDGVVVLTFLPGLIAGSESIGRLDEVLSAAGSPPRVVINVAELRVISSVFLATLVRLHQRIAAAHGIMKVCGLNEIGLQTIRTSKLDTILHIASSQQEALADCR